jgi:transposase
MAQRRTFAPEKKREICRQLVSGEKRLAQVCREHTLAESVVIRWRKEYQQRGEHAFTPRSSADTSAEARIAELERFCGQLALENQVLKKALQTVRSRSATP